MRSAIGSNQLSDDRNNLVHAHLLVHLKIYSQLVWHDTSHEVPHTKWAARYSSTATVLLSRLFFCLICNGVD
jgi:hypothetical protein